MVYLPQVGSYWVSNVACQCKFTSIVTVYFLHQVVIVANGCPGVWVTILVTNSEPRYAPFYFKPCFSFIVRHGATLQARCKNVPNVSESFYEMNLSVMNVTVPLYLSVTS